MSVTLDHRLVAADAGQVADAGPGRPDPEVPERARRRSFTAKYKLEILAAYDTAEPAGKGCTPATSWNGGGPATPGRWQAWPAPAGGRLPIPGTRRSPG